MVMVFSFVMFIGVSLSEKTSASVRGSKSFKSLMVGISTTFRPVFPWRLPGSLMRRLISQVTGSSVSPALSSTAFFRKMSSRKNRLSVLLWSSCPSLIRLMR